MRILLAKKQTFISFSLGLATLLFSGLSLSFTGGAQSPVLNYLPSRDDSATVGIDESERGCVYRESSGDWTVDDCDYVGAHYACYNGTNWQVAQALGTTNNPGEPRDGNAVNKEKSIDSWDPVKADNACKVNFGPSYFFSVPVSAEEDEKLGNQMTKLVAAKKRTWVYYYSNTNDIPATSNYWLGNRTKYTNLLSGTFDNTAVNGGIADCTVMDRTTGLWQDAACTDSYAFACFDSGSWVISAQRDQWKAGFAVCDENFGALSLYAVPRDSTENAAIQSAALPVGGTGVAADYNKVWLNRTDLAFEQFFISNQTRQAWWGEGQPSNRGNADCAVIDSAGNWIAESCNGVVAYHACYLGDNSSGVAQWALTKDIAGLKESEAALGFGYCKQLDENAEFLPPNTSASNTALKNLLAPGEFVWINYSDQASEGFWKAASPFQDFVEITNVVDGDAQDCGYFSLATDNKRNWLAGQCFAGGASLTQGFACTNGFEWKVATQDTNGNSLQSDLWKDGFTACKAAFGQDYEFAAPHDADQNSRLSLALKLSGNTQAWMNLNDAKSEGTWVSNGPVVNLSPVITSITPDREFSEGQVINLSVTASDPETASSAGLTYQWSIIDTRVGVNNTGTDTVVSPTLTNATTQNVSVSAIDLINDDYYIDLQLQITDADAANPATTTSVFTLKVISPLRAAYDFNVFTNPRLDSSNNGNSLILNTSQVEIKARENNSNDFYAKMDGVDLFEIDGSVSGLQLDAVKDEYTLIYRFRLDELPVSNWAGFVQKGTAGVRQPALFFNKTTNKIQFNNSTTNSTEAELSLEQVRLGQWMTVAYVKNGANTQLYVDKAQLKTPSDPITPVNLQVVPDSSRALFGTSLGYESGNWTFGNVPGASEGIVGGFDDIRIYDRALTANELANIFPDQPRGEFEFANQQQLGDESATDGGVNEVTIPVKRTKGDDGIVSVGYKLVSGSAVLDTDFRLKNDSLPLGDANRGQGTLTWGVHDLEDKLITVELLGDALREGTETFSIELEPLATEPSVGKNAKTDVSIVDKTPNPYGAIGFAPTTATVNAIVKEGDAGVITIERVGSDSQGAFDVLYDIVGFSADTPADFVITNPDFVATGNSGQNQLIGSGRLSFSNDPGQTRQVQTINFNTIADIEAEIDEVFVVNLVEVTDAASNSLSDPATSAILATNRSYLQRISDITTGRISFKQANYAVDEKDQGAGSNQVTVVLERLAGDDGELCVTLQPTGSASSADYSIVYPNASASGQNDVYWADQDSSDKVVQITANNDEIYDPNEILTLAWVLKPSCSAASPTTLTGDVLSTNVAITDFTSPVALRFTESNYSVAETTATKTITIQATQNGDFANRVNNNGFQVFLNRNSLGAKEAPLPGAHYGSLQSQEVISFAAGETQKTISVPVIDNCEAAPSFAVGFNLEKTNASLTNTLPTEKIDVSSANTNLAIDNVVPSLNVVTAVDNSGVSNAAQLIKSLYRVTTAGGDNDNGFDPTNLKLVATNNTGDGCPISYDWNLDSATPALPSPGVGKANTGLPAAFSNFVNNLGNFSFTEFTLPFVVEDTTLNYSVTVKHPELPAQNILGTVGIGAYWMRLKNYGGTDECMFANGSDGTINETTDCNAGPDRDFTYNKTTKQIVGRPLVNDEYGCWDGRGYSACSSRTEQQFRYGKGYTGDCTSQTQIQQLSNNAIYREYAGNLVLNNSQGLSLCVSRDWDWVGTP